MAGFFKKLFTKFSRGSRIDWDELEADLVTADIGIMWTGSSIVSDSRTPALKGINKYLQRPAFIWWNFPVTDYVRHALFLSLIHISRRLRFPS